MDAAKYKREARIRRHRRVRKKVRGTAERPRLAVFRSNKNISAQLIDDRAGKTLASASSLESSVVSGATGNAEAAASVGKVLGERGAAAGVSKVVFDRGGNAYHGRVKALADAAREAGMEF